MVYYQEAYIPLEGHVREQPGKIVVQYSCSLICKCTETENVSDGAVIVFDDDIRTVLDWSDVDRRFRYIIHLALIVDGGSLHIWKLLFRRGCSWLPLHGASDSLMRPLHVAFCSGGT